MEIINVFIKIISYGFVQRAIISGVFIAVTSAVLGVFLVLRRQALISDGLSHVTFASVAFALFLGFPPLLVSIPIVIFASVLINKLAQRVKIYSDAAIGLVAATGIAVGVAIVSKTQGFNVDIYSYLFGSMLSVTKIEVYLSVVLAFFVLLTLFLYFNELFLAIYDSDYASISGIRTKYIDFFFSTIQSVTIVLGVKILGAMLISSLIIFPVITAIQFVGNFKKLVLVTAIISMSSVVIGIIISFLINTPAGATVVLVNMCFFVIAIFILKLKQIFNYS